MRSLHEIHKEARSSDRWVIEEFCRWHDSDWKITEERWRQYVSQLSTAREMQSCGAAEALRRAEGLALDFIGILLHRPGGCQCPFCRRVYEPAAPYRGSRDGE